MTTRPITHARLHRLDNITLKTLRALDRARTVVMLPVGMQEEHGDHLPIGTDTFAVDALALAAAAWLLEHDADLHVLLLPTIPYGTDPVDLRRPDLFGQAGSVWISRETLKQIVAEVAGHMVRFGFRYIFPLGFHGGPGQSVALDEVCADMRAHHSGLVMYEPVGYVMAGAEQDVTPGLATLLGRPLTANEEVVLKGSIHASMFETSLMLHLHPNLVNPTYKTLRSLEWKQLYQMPDWPGYLGAGPAHANPEIGAAVLRWRGVRAAALIRRAMNGEDLSALVRHPDRADLQDATSVSEAPVEELPERTPHIEDNPAMIIPARQFDDLHVPPDSPQPDSAPGGAPHDETTPLSSLMDTKPMRPDRPGGGQPPEEEQP